jgi:hypothetical protein
MNFTDDVTDCWKNMPTLVMEAAAVVVVVVVVVVLVVVVVVVVEVMMHGPMCGNPS